MKLKNMVQPFYIGNVKIRNRFAVTAMVTNMCDSEGYATEQYIRYHEAKSKGGYGLIITEDYAVNAHAGGYARVARIYKEDMIPGHRKMTEAVHKHGAKIFCQIYHAGRQSNSNVNGGVPTKSASAQACPWNRQMTEEMSVEEIHQTVKDFGISARNAKAAGFDGVEIHAGNGYLIAGFLSFTQNKRTDEYGGPFNNRMRILREVYEEVRRNVGEDFPVMVRFSAEEHTYDGRTLPESKMIASELERWGVNAINCSNGIYGSYNLAQVSVAPQGHAWTSGNAKAIKEIVHIPVMAVNSIDDPLMAEQLVAEGSCDFVGMSRCSLADPDMPNKAMQGRFDEIRPCVRCVQGCTGWVVKQIPIRCCLNPMLGNEYKYTFEEQPEAKKVLIIGGGPGGMQAAIAAGRRGHKVTLWEKKNKLGGEVGIETAMYLADGERGEITVVEMAHKMAEKTDQTRYIPMRRFLLDHEVRLMNDTKIVEVTDTELVVEAAGSTMNLPYDAIVVSMGYHPDHSLEDSLASLGDKLVVIGDARQCRNAMEAAAEGFDAGYYA